MKSRKLWLAVSAVAVALVIWASLGVRRLRSEKVIEYGAGRFLVSSDYLKDAFNEVPRMQKTIQVGPGTPAGEGMAFQLLDPPSPLFRLGLLSGDVVLTVNGNGLDKAAEIFATLEKFADTGGALKVEILRFNKPLTLSYRVF